MAVCTYLFQNPFVSDDTGKASVSNYFPSFQVN